MGPVVEWLKYFGITPQQIVPLILVGIIFAIVLWKSILRDLKQEVDDLHHATKELQKCIESNIKDKDGKNWSFQHVLNPKPVWIFGKTGSPVIPNDEGEKLLKESGFYEQYPKFKEQLFKLIDSKNPRTLYDYEKLAASSLLEIKDIPEMDKIKEYAVNNPKTSLELIFEVASWVIRDDYDKYKKNR